jgi:hypothetical protein
MKKHVNLNSCSIIGDETENQMNQKEKEAIDLNFVHAIFEEEKKEVKEKWLAGLFNRGVNVDERYNKWEVNKRTKWSKKGRNRRETIRCFYIKRKTMKNDT